MRIAWFGGSTFRFHVGGRIVVIDASAARGATDARELTSGADLSLRLGDTALPIFDAASWKPNRARRLIDPPATPALTVSSIGEKGLVVEYADDGPLFVAPAAVPLGNYVVDAVVVLFGDADAVIEGASRLLSHSRPRLTAIASDGLSDAQFAALASVAGQSAVQMLERGFAIEA